MKKPDNLRRGSSFDGWLKEEGLSAQAHAVAVKRVLAWQVQEAMRAECLTKTEMAKRMNTSRAALDRVLDPDNMSVTLLTLDKVADALGKHLRVEFADGPA